MMTTVRRDLGYGFADYVTVINVQSFVSILVLILCLFQTLVLQRLQVGETETDEKAKAAEEAKAGDGGGGGQSLFGEEEGAAHECRSDWPTDARGLCRRVRNRLYRTALDSAAVGGRPIAAWRRLQGACKPAQPPLICGRGPPSGCSGLCSMWGAYGLICIGRS